MKNIEQLSRMSETFLAMRTLLVNHLNFDDMKKYGNNILLGMEAEIPDLDHYTKRYLHQLSAMTHSLPDESQPISLE